jgi:murein L,D-transpeptidase YafK
MKTLQLTIFLLLLVAASTSFTKPIGANDYYLVVDKSDYELNVYDANNNWIATYPCVFGNKNLGDKMCQGDRQTPEGEYHITGKRPHAKWNKFFALDYPNALDVEKFAARKAQGLIPANAKIGGEIGIHGTWPKEEFCVDLFQNWTQGCVSTKNEYITELYQTIPVGTKVIIRK